MKPKILLVDDEEIVVEVVSIALGTEERYDLVVANSGEEAIPIALEQQPDLILMDVDMPGMNGFEACRQLKADSKTQSIPVILLTAMVQLADVQEGRSAGAEGYIMKPFSPRDLSEKVFAATSGTYRPGAEVRLADGRIGKVIRRVILTKQGTETVGYHVATDLGGTATIAVEELTPVLDM